MPHLDLEGLLKEKRILICCGSGGVGKTTISATLGVQAALLGKKVLTLTIDPAKRLANSLGLTELGNTETLVPRQKFLDCGKDPSGSLHAMMLDTKRTFDELISRYAPSEAITANILNNSFYQNLSSAMAGSHEYLAMEKLYQIYLRGRYDLIVLDTPPTRHALDFLEAPNRVRAFFDRNISQWFLKPYMTMGRVGMNLLNRTAGTVFKTVERLSGSEFVRDVTEFVTGLADSFDIFRSRAEEVMHVLRGESTAFLLITGTERTALDEAAYFYERLQEGALPFGGIIVNRFHASPLPAGDPSAPPYRVLEEEGAACEAFLSHLQAAGGLPATVARGLVENYRHQLHLFEQDRSILADFVNRFSTRIPVRTVPVFDKDIFDLDGLLRVSEVLFAPDAD